MSRLFNDWTVFYNFSGGMESAAMLVVDRERIRETGAIVRWANTGKHFPEMEASIEQIEASLDLSIVRLSAPKTFDEELFEPGSKGGLLMLRRGIPECSIRMKRRPLKKHAESFSRPWEINLGFNSAEVERAESFTDRNERPWCHWRFPLIEAAISRERTWQICIDSGFTILVEMYRKIGRLDCFWCPNQRPSQALNVAKYYPELAAEWIAAEERKGHSFMPVPLKTLMQKPSTGEAIPAPQCACFGGTESVIEEIEAMEVQP